MKKTNVIRVVITAALLLTGAAGIYVLMPNAQDSVPRKETFNNQTVTVYKSPTCGCCTKWEDHLRNHGFHIRSNRTEDMAGVKSKHKIPSDLQSCHTAVIGNYVIEGHVPADAIISMLRDQPDIAGLSVPGMPIGSPGMEVGNQKDPYDVIAFDGAGNRRVYLKK